MSSERRLFGRRKAAQCGLAFGAAVLEGCALEPRESYLGEGGWGGLGGGGGAAGSSGGAAGSSGSSIIEVSPPSGPPTYGGAKAAEIGNPPAAEGCGSAGAPLFCDELIWNQAPARRVLYSWTTAEQLEELRADRILLTRTEREGAGRGYAFSAIDALAASTAPAGQLLAKVNELFSKARYAWPKPWATRMGWPGESYGDRLIEITLRPEAWTLVVRDPDAIAVIDLDNQVVPIEQALAHSERIGAVYFVRTESNGAGSLSPVCSGGFREFIVGNEAMVERWAIETADIRGRIEADAALFERFLTSVRESGSTTDISGFAAEVACSWDYPTSGEVGTYLRALALASELYAPTPSELAVIIETLRASLFEPNPLIVEPGG